MADRTSARQIAVACQGGGSHAAFCAGALKAMLTAQEADGFRVTGLSGTSGGAVCATLAWYALAQGRADPHRAAAAAAGLLETFWTENTPAQWWERGFNEAGQIAARLPVEIRTSPYSYPLQEMLDLAATAHQHFGVPGPRPEFVSLATLLDKHAPGLARVRFDDVTLLLGAVDVKTGDFKVFNSREQDISVQAVLASAALPTLVRAVHIGGHDYWDGLFSQNPPLHNFVADPDRADAKPDELWVLQVNPQAVDLPITNWEIEDRRNELAGNLSLNQEIGFIRRVNRWLVEGRLSCACAAGQVEYKPVIIYRIVMDGAALEPRVGTLDLASKLDRRPDLIAALIEQGETQARLFLPVRRFVAEIWLEADAGIRRDRTAALFHGGKARDIGPLDTLLGAFRAFAIEIENLQFRCTNPADGQVSLDWILRGADADGTPLARSGTARFDVSAGRLENATIGVT
ncbi:MAG: patatin-like phospholipase family protein [Rhodocyclaceae bacterium]